MPVPHWNREFESNITGGAIAVGRTQIDAITTEPSVCHGYRWRGAALEDGIGVGEGDGGKNLAGGFREREWGLWVYWVFSNPILMRQGDSTRRREEIGMGSVNVAVNVAKYRDDCGFCGGI